MVNLLPKASAPPFADFDRDQRARFEERARCVFALAATATATARFATGLAETFETELEELESSPTLVVAQALLDQLHQARTALVATPAPAAQADPRSGRWLCYSPGRSLSTGEAEIASRGYFDVLDRPPILHWVDAIDRPLSPGSAAREVAIITWVPEEAVERARAGRSACRTQGLAFLDEVADGLSAQLAAPLGTLD